MKICIVVVNHSGGPSDFSRIVEVFTQDACRVRQLTDQPEYIGTTAANLRKALGTITTEFRTLYRIASKGRSWILGFITTAKFLVLNLFALFKAPARFARQKWIERVLYEKHLAALELATEFHEGPTLVLEADARITDEMVGALRESIEFLFAKRREAFVAFLAEGYSLTQLKVSLLSGSMDLGGSGFCETKPATSNTTCAYLVSNSGAAEILRFLRESKASSAADWSLAHALQETNVVALHALPPLILHGSIRDGLSTVRIE